MNYIIKDISNYNALVYHLIYTEDYKFIYKYEEINEFVKNKYKLLVISLSDINIDENDVNCNDNEYQKFYLITNTAQIKDEKYIAFICKKSIWDNRVN